MTDSIERLSFELTTAALAEQERAVSSLRLRAGTVIGAASIASSLLGASANGRSLDPFSVLAIAAFVLSLATAIWVLALRDLRLSFDGRKLLVDSDRGQTLDVDEGYRAVCRWIEPHLDYNSSRIDRLAAWLEVSCLLLATEVVLWTISLGG